VPCYVKAIVIGAHATPSQWKWSAI